MNEASKDLIYEKTPSDTEKSKEEKGRLKSTASFRQINGFADSSDRINQLLFTGNYSFKKLWSVSLAQTLNQHYMVNPRSKDWGLRIKDTILSINRRFNPYKSQLTLSFSSTLPFSDHSQINDILTVSTAYLKWNLKLNPLLNFKSKWIKKPVFFIQPFSRYHISAYTTGPTKGQSSGGIPLPKFSFGLQNMSLKFDITDYFSLTGSYGNWLIFPP